MGHANNASRLLNWNAFWWLMGSICIPISLPYIVCKLMCQLRLRKNKHSLKDKVSSVHYSSVPQVFKTTLLTE